MVLTLHIGFQLSGWKSDMLRGRGMEGGALQGGALGLEGGECRRDRRTPVGGSAAPHTAQQRHAARAAARPLAPLLRT